MIHHIFYLGKIVSIPGLSKKKIYIQPIDDKKNHKTEFSFALTHRFVC